MKLVNFYNRILRKFLNLTFRFWQRLGFHITPVHYYQPIPDTRNFNAKNWEKRSKLVGINMKEKSQIELLSDLKKNFKKEFDSFPIYRTQDPCDFYVKNEEFGPVDAELLYCIVRHFKPKKIIEVGSGYSSCIFRKSILKNKQEYGLDCQLTIIDPFLKGFLKNGLSSFSKFVEKEVQKVDLSEFEKLEENDILFIDSSHILKMGSDVQYEYLEILPRLKKGVIVHIHDIFLPAEYLYRWVMKENTFFNEQYLLQAFLAFNNNFEVLFACSYMHLNYPELLSSYSNNYIKKENWPGSFWLKRVT